MALDLHSQVNGDLKLSAPFAERVILAPSHHNVKGVLPHLALDPHEHVSVGQSTPGPNAQCALNHV